MLRAALSLLAAVLLAGCASLPPAQPITSIETIQGRWQGQIRFGFGSYQMLYLTVNPDATVLMEWGVNTRWGRVLIGGGRARFEIYIWSGNLGYFAGPEGRILTMQSDFAAFDAQLTPR